VQSPTTTTRWLTTVGSKRDINQQSFTAPLQTRIRPEFKGKLGSEGRVN